MCKNCVCSDCIYNDNLKLKKNISQCVGCDCDICENEDMEVFFCNRKKALDREENK